MINEVIEECSDAKCDLLKPFSYSNLNSTNLDRAKIAETPHHNSVG